MLQKSCVYSNKPVVYIIRINFTVTNSINSKAQTKQHNLKTRP